MRERYGRLSCIPPILNFAVYRTCNTLTNSLHFSIFAKLLQIVRESRSGSSYNTKCGHGLIKTYFQYRGYKHPYLFISERRENGGALKWHPLVCPRSSQQEVTCSEQVKLDCSVCAGSYLSLCGSCATIATIYRANSIKIIINRSC